MNNNSKNRKISFKKLRVISWLLKIFSSSLFAFLVLSMGITMFLQYPFIQTKVAEKAASFFSERTGFPITIKSVSINWFDVVHLKDVHVKDTSNNEMIYLEELVIDYQFRNLLQDGDIYLDQVILRNGKVNLLRGQTLNMTGFISAIQQLAKKKSTKKKRKRPKFHITYGSLENMSFSYEKPEASYFDPELFDYNHFGFNNIYGEVSNFRISADTIELQAHQVHATETKTKKNVNELHAHFMFTKRRMSFGDLHAVVGKSIIRDSLVLVYDTVAAFSNFNEEVEILAEVKNSIIHTEDLAVFTSYMAAKNDTYQINGKFRGKINNFRLYNMKTRFGESSLLTGDISFRGLPVLDETLMNLNFEQSNVNTKDLSPYFFADQNRILQKFGRVNFNGTFIGFYNDFVSQGAFETNLGYFETDINLETIKNTYRGNILARDFELGKLIEQSAYVGKINMKGRIAGTGLALSRARLDFDGAVNSIEMLGYSYKNIITDGHFEEGLFKGKMKVNDPNIALFIDGEVNVKDETFNFWAEIDSTYLHNLGFTNQPSFLKTNIDARFEGLSWENVSGKLDLLESNFGYNNKYIDIEQLSISTTKDSLTFIREANIASELFQFNTKGTFDLITLYPDALRYLKEFSNHIELKEVEKELTQIEETEIEKRKRNKKAIPELHNYWMDFDLSLYDVNNLISLFEDSLYLSPASQLNGNLIFGDTTELLLSYHADTIVYHNYEFIEDSLLLFTGRYSENETDSLDFLFESQIISKKQDLRSFETEDLNFTSSKLGNTILFNASIDHTLSEDEANLNGNIAFYPEHFDISLTNTNFLFLNERWIQNGLNKIVFDDNIHFEDVSFANKNHLLLLDGTISTDSTKAMDIILKNFEIDMLNNYSEKKLAGNMNAAVKIRDIYNTPRFESDITIDSLQIDQFYLGGLNANSTWSDQYERLVIDATLSRKEFYSIDIDGYYSTKASSTEKFKMEAVLQEAPLFITEPFLKGVFSDIQGVATGRLQIAGSPESPILEGILALKNGGIKIDYLNTNYSFNDTIFFENQLVRFKDFDLIDTDKNKGVLNGAIFQNKANTYEIDLWGKMKNLKVLNTKEKDDVLYYGEAIGTGSVHFSGPFSDLAININATTEKGTKIYIPLEGSEDVEEREFITFISKIVKDSINPLQKKQESFGLLLNMDIQITPDAYCE
ncbi:MAG: translocation/assembly module TamB domain-containing protein, partial [Bacteroidota bacterium]